MELKQAVVFAILMENNEGIVGKHPNYILEKLRRCEECYREEELLALLDSKNEAKYREWKARWGVV